MRHHGIQEIRGYEKSVVKLYICRSTLSGWEKSKRHKERMKAIESKREKEERKIERGL